MISHKYKCIFIHIPKCAGTTVEDYFVSHAKSANYWETPLLSVSNKFHLPALREKGLAETINLFPDHFTFTFVRNPFDRFLSCWLFGINERKVRNIPPAYHNLREFIALATELLEAQKRGDIRPDDRFGPHRTEFRDLGHERYHLKPQVDFLLDRHPKTYFGVKRFNDAPCSFIGRCETFERDFFRLTDLLGIPRHPLNSRRVSKERSSGNEQRKHYSAWYDETTRRLVEDLYAEDLQALGYEFEDQSAVSVPAPLYDLETVRARRQKSGVAWWRWCEVYARRAGFILDKAYPALKRRCKKYLFGIKL